MTGRRRPQNRRSQVVFGPSGGDVAVARDDLGEEAHEKNLHARHAHD